MLTKEHLISVLAFGIGVAFPVQLSSLAIAQQSVRVTIGTYNVEYFFDEHDDPYTDDERYPVKSEEAQSAVAETIRSVNVDFLALQEIENQGVLEDFNRRFLHNLGYRFQWVNQRSGKNAINLAFLSRVPIGEVTVYRFDRFTLPGGTGSWSFVRDLVLVTLEPTKDVTLKLFMVHFKAQSGAPADDPGSAKWRLAEARQVHARAAALLRNDPSAWIAVIGDVNDVPLSPAYRALTRPEHGIALIDVHSSLPREQRSTLLRQSNYQIVEPGQPVDYILVSPTLARHLVRQSVGAQLPTESKASDHGPLIASFDLPIPEP